MPALDGGRFTCLPADISLQRRRVHIRQTAMGGACAPDSACVAIVSLFRSARPTEEAAVQLLQRTADTHTRAKSCHFESIRDSSLSSDIHYSRSRHSETLAAIPSENKLRFESREQTGWYVAVSDGKTLWRAAPYIREYTRTSIAAPVLETKGGGQVAEGAIQRARFAMSKYDRLDEGLKNAGILRIESIEAGDIPIECTVVRADYESLPGALGIKGITRTFWIDGKRNPSGRNDNQRRSFARGSIYGHGEPPPDTIYCRVHQRTDSRLAVHL
jgi:hypothetical protein